MFNNVRKLFVLSDIHGFFTEMKRALDDAGYDSDNPAHLLVCCGDLFDRGHENLKVLRYFAYHPRCILVRGNHDDRFAEILDTKRVDSRDEHNRTVSTLRELLGGDCILPGGFLVYDENSENVRLFRDLYARMENYFEFGDYIFVHGWMPLKIERKVPFLLPDWRNADDDVWADARWVEWQWMVPYLSTASEAGKTVVSGHRPSAYGYKFDASRSYTDYGIFRTDGIIAIDACTALSRQVNVLVLDV